MTAPLITLRLLGCGMLLRSVSLISVGMVDRANPPSPSTRCTRSAGRFGLALRDIERMFFTDAMQGLCLRGRAGKALPFLRLEPRFAKELRSEEHTSELQ